LYNKTLNYVMFICVDLRLHTSHDILKKFVIFSTKYMNQLLEGDTLVSLML